MYCLPLETVDKYVTSKLYIPQKEDNTYLTKHWKTNNSHLTTEQLDLLTSFISKYDQAISKPDDPLGKFNLFQININLMPGKDVTQHKRNTNVELFPLSIGLAKKNRKNYMQ